MPSNIIEQFVAGRMAMAHVAKSITNEQADIIPAFSNNNVKWNVGHVIVSADQFVYGGRNVQSTIPKEYHDFFKSGSKPTADEAIPFTLEELCEVLVAQSTEIVKDLKGILDEKIENPMTIAGMNIRTWEDVVLFCAWHEAIHFGVINTLIKAVK